MAEIVSRPAKTRYVGIDFGLARIGLALSSETHTIAMKLATIVCEKKLALTAKKLMDYFDEHQRQNKYSLEAIIIGMPLMMSGKSSFLSDEVTHFITLLKEHTSLPIICWDERLTTVQAERSLKEGGHLRRKQRAKLVDEVSAVLILQSYLDWRILETEREKILSDLKDNNEQ